LGRFPLPIAPDGQISVFLTPFEGLMSKSKTLEHVFEKKMSALDELRKSILQKAFSGEL
jgi:type I restriction enzyme S subunit